MRVFQALAAQSHTSSACLTVVSQPDRLAALIDAAREFHIRDSAPGSDAGLCVATWDQATEAVQHFGQRAKQDVLTMAEALALAQQRGIMLEGLTGDHGGVIGSLAAIGLRKAGNDGRFLWLKGLREASGIYTADQLRREVPIGGLAHAVKPLSRALLSSVTGLPYTSLLSGVVYPTATHLLFGFIGAFVGAGMVWGYRRLSKR